MILPSRWGFAALAAASALVAFEPRIGLAADLALLLLIALDGLCCRVLGPPAMRLDLPARLGQGDEGEARLEVEHRGGWRLDLRVVLDLPAGLLGERERAVEPRAARLLPAAHASLGWPLAARERGEHRVGALHFRILGPLRLGWWQGKLPLDRPVEVIPGLRGVRAFRLLALHHQLQHAGLRSVRQRGAGGAFESLREYVRGDDIRHLDWKATARRGTLMVRQYEAERSQNLVLCIDCGRSMLEEAGELPAPGSARLDQALAAAVALGEVARVWNDHVGVFAFSDAVHAVLAPGRYPPDRIPRLLAGLRARGVEPDYPRALVRLSRLMTRRSLLVFFGDVIDDDVSAPMAAQLARLARRHLPFLVALRNRGLFAASLERAPDLWTACRRAAAAELVLLRSRTLARMRERGIVVADVHPEAAVAAAVNRYIEFKRRGAL